MANILDLAQEAGIQITPSSLETSLKSASMVPFDMLDGSKSPPPIQWLLKGANDEGLPRSIVGILAGAGGVGKSGLVLDMAIAVASGGDWLDYCAPEAGPVLYLAAEEDGDEIHRRLWKRAKTLTQQAKIALTRNLCIVPLAGTSATLISRPPGFDAQPRASDAFKGLERYISNPSGPAWRLVILDPLVRFASGDAEKDNAVATAFVEIISQITKARGRPNVLLVHHTSQSARATGSTDAASVRGVTGITDAARWVGVLTSSNTSNEADGNPEEIVFTVAKSNMSRVGKPMALDRSRDTGTLIYAGRHWKKKDTPKKKGKNSPNSTTETSPTSTTEKSPTPEVYR